MTATPVRHRWSSDALFSKALLYVGEMEHHTANDWQFGLWAALSLELLARAALAQVSPTLLADGRDWRNIYDALGHAPTATRFSPTSVPTNEVFARLREVIPAFRPELVDFCITQLARRNGELHSGEEVFATLGTSEWLPRYYAACKVLLEFMGKALGDIFRDPKSAEEMIAMLEDTAAKAVKQDINAHRQVWQNKTDEERTVAMAQAVASATRPKGHRANCPACGSAALIHGAPQGPVSTQMDEDMITQRQTMLPSSFECSACGLRISGLSKLSACGLGDAFTATHSFTPAEFFGLHTEEELEEARAQQPEWDEDFNEY